MTSLVLCTLTVILATLLALLLIDYRQTPWHVQQGLETNRAILFLHERFGYNGITIWFGACAIAALLLFTIALDADKPGAVHLVGSFGIGIEFSVTRENFRRMRRVQ